MSPAGLFTHTFTSLGALLPPPPPMIIRPRTFTSRHERDVHDELGVVVVASQRVTRQSLRALVGRITRSAASSSCAFNALTRGWFTYP